MTDAPVLTIHDLTIAPRSGGRALLDGVSLELARGEVLGVVGESGAGKTTLGLAALGHVRTGLKRLSGSARLEGEDLFTMPKAELRAARGGRLAYVAQSAAAAFNPAHRLLAQCIEAVVWHGLSDPAAARREALKLFSALRLPEPETLARRFTHQVSGGQLQRAMTAMAMMGAPEVIVFDEPTTGLDVTTQARVLAALKEMIRASGAAALYITHDLAVVAQMASRICVMKDGAIIEQGPTGQIMRHPAHPYTRSLWAVRKAARKARGEAGGTPKLEFRGVRAGYGRGEDALRGVSLRVPAGRTVALAGQSGSGKTTLGRVAAGLLPPRAGEVLLDGEALPGALAGRGRDVRGRIQFIHQSADTSLNPAQSVRGILSRPLKLFHNLRGAELEARLRGLLEMVELEPELARRKAAHLSGGQKQRLALARALAAEPEVIICDEITSALDVIVQRGILDLLARTQAKTGVSYLFITHDIATVRAIADFVAVMRDGVIIEQGPRDEVLGAPREDYTKELLASVPEPEPGWLERRMGRMGQQG